MLDALSVAALAYSAGWRGDDIARAVAIASRESGFNPAAHNVGPRDDSYGLWQINMLGSLGPARRAQFGLGSDAELTNPAVNARAAFTIWKQAGWRPWSTNNNGAYLSALPEARDAARRVTEAANGPGGLAGFIGRLPGVQGIGGAAGSIPGIGGLITDAGGLLSGPLSSLPNPLEALAAPFGALADFAKFITDPANLRRLAQLVGGALLVAAAALIILRDSISTGAKLAGKISAGVATGGASVAADVAKAAA